MAFAHQGLFFATTYDYLQQAISILLHDTGAVVSIVSWSFYSKLPKHCKTKLTPSNVPIFGAAMVNLLPIGQTELTVQIGDAHYKGNFIVCKAIKHRQKVVGLDFQRKHQLFVKWNDKGTLDLFSAQPKETYLTTQIDRHMPWSYLSTINTIETPPSHSVFIECGVDTSLPPSANYSTPINSSKGDISFLYEQIDFNRDLLENNPGLWVYPVSYRLELATKQKTATVLVNHSDCKVTIPAQTKICGIAPINSGL